MNGRIIPETAKRADWPRLVAQAHKELSGRVANLERIAVRTITATASVATTDVVILADATSAAVTVNLPAAASSKGRFLFVKKIDASANNVTIDGNALETIDGATTKATATQWAGWQIVCDGTGWFIL